MPLSPGTRLGSYEIVSLLGAGGMGEVYRARDPRLQREIALKVLPDVADGWTPDGRRVAYASEGNVWVQALDGGAPRQLTRFTDSRRNRFLRVVT